MKKDIFYYNINEENGSSINPENTQIINTNSIEDSNIVKDPNGNYINMDEVRGLVDRAILEMSNTFHMGLGESFSSTRFIYTWKCDTLCTDGRRIAINPSFILNVYNSEKKGGIIRIAYLLLHECLHILFQHCYDPAIKNLRELDPFNNKKVNVAMDAVINFIIENSTYDATNDEYPFMGITNKLDGYIIGSDVIGSEYAGCSWREIFDGIDDDKLKNMNELIFKYVNPVPYKNSQIWYKGFVDGFVEIYKKLQNERLIESKIRIYLNPLMEEQYPIPELIKSILNNDNLSDDEKIDRIYDMVGDGIDGDSEVEQDMDSNSDTDISSYKNTNDTNNNSDNNSKDNKNIQNNDINNNSDSFENEDEDQDSKPLGEYEKGKIYGVTFALYTYNCNGNSDYVKNTYFPSIFFPPNLFESLPKMQKRNKNSLIDINRMVDLNSLSDDLLRTGTVKY